MHGAEPTAAHAVAPAAVGDVINATFIDVFSHYYSPSSGVDDTAPRARSGFLFMPIITSVMHRRRCSVQHYYAAISYKL